MVENNLKHKTSINHQKVLLWKHLENVIVILENINLIKHFKSRILKINLCYICACKNNVQKLKYLVVKFMFKAWKSLKCQLKDNKRDILHKSRKCGQDIKKKCLNGKVLLADTSFDSLSRLIKNIIFFWL